MVYVSVYHLLQEVWVGDRPLSAGVTSIEVYHHWEIEIVWNEL
ncbi:hypothetical protein [Zarconia navalis]|nr:hypothetical protein [Zarconia navalis]